MDLEITDADREAANELLKENRKWCTARDECAGDVRDADPIPWADCVNHDAQIVARAMAPERERAKWLGELLLDARRQLAFLRSAVLCGETLSGDRDKALLDLIATIDNAVSEIAAKKPTTPETSRVVRAEKALQRAVELFRQNDYTECTAFGGDCVYEDDSDRHRCGGGATCREVRNIIHEARAALGDK